MKTSNKYEELRQAVGGFQQSPWLEDFKKKESERPWMYKSQMIALRILMTLRSKGITQCDLALSLGVSPQQVNKWVKGSENFTLETITKLEQVLDIELIQIAKTLK